MKQNKYINHDGYTLLECLLALLIISLSLSLSVTSFRLLKDVSIENKVNLQDEIGIYQIQITLAKADITSISDDQICYSTIDNEYTLHLLNNRIISQPGTIIYLIDVDDVCFYESEYIYYIEYKRNEETYVYPIALP